MVLLGGYTTIRNLKAFKRLEANLVTQLHVQGADSSSRTIRTITITFFQSNTEELLECKALQMVQNGKRTISASEESPVQ